MSWLVFGIGAWVVLSLPLGLAFGRVMARIQARPDNSAKVQATYRTARDGGRWRTHPTRGSHHPA